MTQFNLETTEKLSIQSYDMGEVKIMLSGGQEGTPSTRVMNSSFILTPSKIVENWNITDVSELNAESFAPFLELNPELVILGTGATLSFPPHEILQLFHKAGIGVEVMNTASACRTYNVLVSENRYVTAGLLMI